MNLTNPNIENTKTNPLHFPVVIIGGGPAGLTAAFKLVEKQITPLVLEKDKRVGGIARTEIYKGYRFDIGGHRFYTKVSEVDRLWRQIMGDDFIRVRRLSRIYYHGRFFHYPIQFFDTLFKLGWRESILIMLSYLRSKIAPYPVEDTFDQWVSNRFGRRLYRMFFKTYTEKVWGIPCDKIHAEWAAQRIKGLSLVSTLWNAIFGVSNVKSLIHEFDYPRLGPGMMWERFQDKIESGGGQVWLNSQVVRLHRQGNRIVGLTVRRGAETVDLTTDHVISTMPITELAQLLDPPVPRNVLDAAQRLRYRAFIIVALIIRGAELFPDNWIYVHSPEVKVGRIQNFKNWSTAMVPDPSKTSLGMEFFCDEGDTMWQMSDVALIALATRELGVLGLARAEDIEDGVVLRQPKAYPVYDPHYQAQLLVLKTFFGSMENLQTVGRNGMHRYNNQDHSMLTGMLAAHNVLGEHNDLWNVNTERSYYEEVIIEDNMAEE